MLPAKAFSAGVPVPGETPKLPAHQNQPQTQSQMRQSTTIKPAQKQTQQQPLPPKTAPVTEKAPNKPVTATKTAIQPPAKKQESQQQNINKNQQAAAKPSELNELREQAKFLYNSNNLEEAQQLFNKIPESEKISDDFMFLANIAQDKGKPIDAVFFLKKAIELDDQNYKAHYNLGNLYFADDKINMAIDEYKKVLKIKKDFAYAYYNKGCCYLKKKSWFNAKYEFGLAIKANPEEPSFYYNLAYTYKMMKRAKKAQEALDIYNELMSR